MVATRHDREAITKYHHLKEMGWVSLSDLEVSDNLVHLAFEEGMNRRTGSGCGIPSLIGEPHASPGDGKVFAIFGAPVVMLKKMTRIDGDCDVGPVLVGAKAAVIA